MGVLLGGSTTFSQHPLLQHGRHRPRSLHSYSVPLFPHKKVARKKRDDTKTSAMAHLEEVNRDEESRLQRRTILLAGVCAFPLLQKLRAAAAEAAAGGEPVVFRQGERARRLKRGNRRAKEDDGGLLTSFRYGETEMQTAIQAPQIADNNPQMKDNISQVADGSPQNSYASVVSTLKQNESEKPVHTEEEPENQLLLLLNEVGIFSSGVLGALYAISQKDKTATETKLESMNSMLEDKEASITLMEKNFEERMSNEQGEHRKHIKKLKEEEYALANQLASSNATISSMEKELQSEKLLIEDLRVQLDQAQNCHLQASEEKKALEGKMTDKMNEINFLQDRVTLFGFEIKDKEKHIETLNTSLCGKEMDCKNLNSSLDQMKKDQKNASSAVERLTAENLQLKQELDSKKCSFDELTEKLRSLSAEKDDIDKKFCVLQNDYDNLTFTSAKKADSDFQLLSKKIDEIQQLEQKLGHALDEAKKNHASISSFNKEKDRSKRLLETETKKVANLQKELDTTQQSLKDSKVETSNLSCRVKESETKFKQLEAEYARNEKNFNEKQKSLISSLDEAKSAIVLLTDELDSVRNILDGTRQEHSITSAELKSVFEAQEGLQKELLEAYQKAEIASHELKEERMMVATLRKELDASGEEIKRESESRKALEGEMTEAKKSLSVLKDKTMSLSGELKSANSRAAGLKEEKEMIYKTLMQQDIAKEVQENIEDAQKLIVRLGTERKSLQNRAKKLEGELATAKGEILRLKRQGILSKESMNENDTQANRIKATTSVITRKRNGRKRGGNTQDSSQQ